MGIGDYLSIVGRRWITICVCTILGVFLAGVYTLASPRVYTATATDFVALTSSTSSTDPLTGAQFAAQRVKSYTEIVSSPDVLLPVINELGLNTTPAQLANSITVTNPPQTVLLLVSANSGSAEEAAAVANAVAVQLGRVIERLETPTGQETPPVKVTLTEPATPPSGPSSPRRAVNLTLGFIIGISIGLILALLKEALDRTLKSVYELERLAPVPMLGFIGFDKQASNNRLCALDGKSTVAEGYRTVRANMQFLHVDAPVRTVVISSPTPGDGKTTVACNLAIAIAQGGRSVCLVDADLRKPTVQQYLGINAPVGLTDVLAARIPVSNALVPWNRGMFQVLTSGRIPPNPSELLESNQMRLLVQDLKKGFDVVIIDSSPLLAVADAAVLSHQADGAILVVRYGKSSRDSVRRSVASLTSSGDNLLGTILNAVPVGKKYGYGYGYGYGTEESAQQETAGTKG